VERADISVIVPVFNTERYLAEALESLFAQTLAPAEIIVVDDGSTDSTPTIARRYAGRIRYVRQENAGSSAARNHGLRLAQGAMITFLDADDRYLPTKLERQWRRFLDRPELDLCVCEVTDFDTPDLPAPVRKEPFVPLSRPGQVATWLVRRTLLDRTGGFLEDPRLSHAEGTEIFTRVRESGAVIDLLAEPLVERRLHDANKTTQRERHLDSIAHLMKMRLDRKRSNS
jgi:glycosyltransferase involved in cell wall biosynthesis